jgi:hypothetical protein
VLNQSYQHTDFSQTFYHSEYVFYLKHKVIILEKKILELEEKIDSVQKDYKEKAKRELAEIMAGCELWAVNGDKE